MFFVELMDNVKPTLVTCSLWMEETELGTAGWSLSAKD